MAQRDPLIVYQREGFDLFNAMMDSIKEETIGLLFHLEVTVNEEPAEPAEPIALGVADGRGVVPDLLAAGAAGAPAPVEEVEPAEPVVEQAEPVKAAEPTPTPTPTPTPARAPARAPVTGLAGLGPRRPDHLQYTAPSETGEATVIGTNGGGEFSGVGRNEPCPCGSGKKYKRCHGDPRLHA
jgi:preprotein translocase subunit SecA